MSLKYLKNGKKVNKNIHKIKGIKKSNNWKFKLEKFLQFLFQNWIWVKIGRNLRTNLRKFAGRKLCLQTSSIKLSQQNEKNSQTVRIVPDQRKSSTGSNVMTNSQCLKIHTKKSYFHISNLKIAELCWV